MSSSNSNSSSTFSVLSFADGLWDLTKVAKVIYFTLCFDVLFFYLKGYGLFGIKLGKEFDLSLADLAGMIIALGIFSSVILEVMTLFFYMFLSRVKYSDYLQSKDERNYSRSSTEVFISELRDDALDNGDDMSLKLYKEEQNKSEKNLKEGRLIEIVSVGTFFVFFIEWYLSASDGSSKMFIDWLWEQSKHRDPTTPHYLIGLLVSLALLFYAVAVCWPKEDNRKIYYPKLAKKLRKKEEDRKKKFENM
ncbi:hypothetical protein LZX53_002185 [Salmonella enterica]|uniref:hypothetical protein n=1 Tax=Salmonella enterica TaxID=28901 RepID=UPI000D5648A3|nr:hypothetical protein [Salmonella enterica]EBP3338699.1 hypothetical protein [Salmonella enterica subsp. enterica]ECS8495095.1 hypothetical protein [Salmonella enterica subsp. enterica serovar Give]EAO5075183.1 hypothetical protein [Salmonella enterica]EAQ7631282.1 hypothetical protein [Salmonella enterica]EBN6094400.1 hypothetical protein [Salmonella enterica]